jgi:anaphase-promoting complex subunit 2
MQDVWTMDELTSRVGPVDKGAALKALVTWVDLGVLKEDKENTFTLLEIAEGSKPSAKDTLPRAGKIIWILCLTEWH